MTCEDCGATKEETISAAGHEADLSSWHKDESSHWHICVRCQKELPETKAAHQYALLYGTWRCTDCFAKHSEACTGEVKATSLNETSHKWSCTSCNAVSGVEEHHFDESGICTDCGHTKAPDIPEHDFAANARDFHDNGDGTHTGTCSICGKSVTQAHDTLGLGGGCSVCGYTPQPIDPTVPVDPTEPTEPETPTDQEGEHTDE